MGVRSKLWSEAVTKYMSENCNIDGSQKTQQLSKSQIRDKDKLIKRVRKGEIQITASDKGNSIVVMPLQLYHKMVKVHSDKDKLVTWKQLEEAQKSVRSHARGLAKIFNLGGNKGDRNLP